MNPTPSTTNTEPEAATGRSAEETEPAAAAAVPETDASAARTEDEKRAPDGAQEAQEVSDDGGLIGDADDESAVPPRASSGVGAAAASVVAAALGLVSLTGTWTGRVGAERETLVGQLHTSQSASASQQISELYGDAWHTTAAINGAVGLGAVILAVIVLLALRRTAPLAWAKPVAVAALVLGAVGVVVSLGMYFDLFASLPSAPATPTAPTAPPAS
ncbi:hypothetical protein [Streptomyces fuscigenes]|uniref:hypothetical protein n=1 Tax=Streptomyces fuscigenes TaxID=1528880 RepID=UPI001F327C11|nr:hypothetical protein [Streptomyces fuscigenes]MCF3961231.1 hypothetical protein [Streptomyces fuscigenes]